VFVTLKSVQGNSQQK